MKKLIFFSLLFVAHLITVNAQTPFTILSSHENELAYLKTASVSSFNNPWVGAKLAYNVSGDVSESFILSARAMYLAASGEGWGVPIVGNVGLNNPDSVSNDAGVSIGVFPYKNLLNSGQLQLLVHGGLNYHILDRAEVGSATQFRMLIGLEAALFPRDEGSPVTLSVAPEYTFDSGDGSSQSWGLGITGVVPIANGLGLLMEGTVPFDTGGSSGLKIGVIVNSPID